MLQAMESREAQLRSAAADDRLPIADMNFVDVEASVE